MAIRLDGKQIAAEIRGSLKQKVDEIRKTVPNFSPGLAIVQESFLFSQNFSQNFLSNKNSKLIRFKTILRLETGKIQMFIFV